MCVVLIQCAELRYVAFNVYVYFLTVGHRCLRSIRGSCCLRWLTSENELGVHRSHTSSQVVSYEFDCRSRALSRVVTREFTSYELPGTHHTYC